jgi:hypothetical protein
MPHLSHIEKDMLDPTLNIYKNGSRPSRRLRSPQILKEFEILKFFNLSPPFDRMDENLPLTLKFKIQILNPSDQNFKLVKPNIPNTPKTRH